MDIHELAELVERMRERQNNYFEVKRKHAKEWAHINNALKQSKELEKLVDAEIKNILHQDPQTSIF
jgi:hypothetical protein